MEATLETPVYSSKISIRSVNFFNGRLLSAEDLNTEKSANRDAHKQLGRTLGDGIAYGLEVRLSDDSSAAQPRLVISKGLAVNRRGRTLELLDSPTLLLRRPTNVNPSNGSGKTTSAGFEDCTPPQGGVYLASNEGLYLLTLAPDEQDEGRAMVSGMSNGNVDCNIRYKIDAVQFRLREITDMFLSDVLAVTTALKSLTKGTADYETERRHQIHLLRNKVAHVCFGSADERRQAWITSPFDAISSLYGLLDDLRSKEQLTDCEVPLAILYWASDGLQFVDMWCVRRRINGARDSAAWSPKELAQLSSEAKPAWSPQELERRISETEAIWMQFQSQIAEMLANESDLSKISATQRFRFLPPAGYLPIQDKGQTKGFVAETFLAGHLPRVVGLIEANQVRALVQQSFVHEPLELEQVGKIRLYQIFELQQAFKTGGTNQNILLFTTTLMANFGLARFGYSNWGVDRFSD